jgi:hypothetical protein
MHPMFERKRLKAGACGALFAALVLAVPSAGAAEGEMTVDAYVDQVEPICKTNVLANRQIFKGAKGEVKAGELKKASTHFLRAATAFGKTIGQLTAVPRPPEHEARLQKWLGLLKTEESLVRKIGKALAAEQKRKAESISVELNRNSNKANNTVLAFGFDYCRIEPSRFG